MIQVLLGSALLLGSFFLLLAGLGSIKFPDPLTRMAAVSKASTLGVSLVVAAAMLGFGSAEEAAKGLALLVILWVSTPVASHLLGRAALRNGTPLAPETQQPELRKEV